MEPTPAAPRLGPKARRAGYRLAAFDTIGSTNDEAMARLRAGDPGRLWVFSPAQTAGRGRRGRDWETLRGNMAASLAAVLPVSAATAATLGFVAGLALDQALAGLLPAEAARRLALKWPNDLLVGDAKLSGILLEAEALPGGQLAVVVGIGVNVVAAPSGLPYPAVALRDLGADVTAEALVERLAEAWTDIEATWDGGRGLDAIRRAWLGRARGLGDKVSVTVGTRRVEGRFETIDADGRLILVGPDGVRRAIAAGDVHFGAGG